LNKSSRFVVLYGVDHTLKELSQNSDTNEFILRKSKELSYFV